MSAVPVAPSSVTNPHLHRLLDPIISLSECEVFSYTPDPDSDPHAESSSSDEEEEATESDDDSFEFDEGVSLGSSWGMPKKGGGGGKMRRGSFKEEPGKGGGFDFDFSSFSDEEVSSPSRPRKRSSSSAVFSDEDDEEEDSSFVPPHLSALPLVGPSTSAPKGSDISTRVRVSQSPFTGRSGCLWSVNYFFVNRRLKRILFISVWARKRGLGWSAGNGARRGSNRQ